MAPTGQSCSHTSLSENGKRASFQIQSFSNYAVARVGHSPLPQHPLPQRPLPQRPLPQRPLPPRPSRSNAAGAQPAASVGDISSEDDQGKLPAGAELMRTFAFAPPQIVPDGTAVLLKSQYSRWSTVRWLPKVQPTGASLRLVPQRPVPVLSTEVTVRLELPPLKFHCDGSGTWWSGMERTVLLSSG